MSARESALYELRDDDSARYLVRWLPPRPGRWEPMKVPGLSEALTRLLYDNVTMPAMEPPEPDTADLADVAEYCGIKRYRDDDLVPLDQYKQDGFIRCSETGAEPDPPYTVIANYPIADDERRVLSNDAYADYVHEHTALAKAQAPVYALLAVGYSHTDIADALGRSRGTIATHARRIRNNYQEAKQTVDILRDF